MTLFISSIGLLILISGSGISLIGIINPSILKSNSRIKTFAKGMLGIFIGFVIMVIAGLNMSDSEKAYMKQAGLEQARRDSIANAHEQIKIDSIQAIKNELIGLFDAGDTIPFDRFNETGRPQTIPSNGDIFSGTNNFYWFTYYDKLDLYVLSEKKYNRVMISTNDRDLAEKKLREFTEWMIEIRLKSGKK